MHLNNKGKYSLVQLLFLLNKTTKQATATLLLVLVLNVFYDVIARYLFNNVSIAMQELEWHLFATIFLLSIFTAFNDNEHVRVDVLYANFSDKRKKIINLIGNILFIFPLSLIIFYYGIDFFMSSYLINETSFDPGGLPYRWIIKSMISIAFFLLACASFVQIITLTSELLKTKPQ